MPSDRRHRRRPAPRGCRALLTRGQPQGEGGAVPLDAVSRRADHVHVSRWARVRLYAAIAAGAGGLLVGVGYAIYARLDSAWSHLAWTGVVVLPLYVLAVWLVSHRPDHLQARRLLLCASMSAVGVALESVVRGAYRELGTGSWVWVANLAHQYSSLVAGAAGGVLLACYPDGEPERRWQRRVVAALWWSLALPPLLLLTRHDLVISPYLFESTQPEPVASPFTVEWLTPLGWPMQILFASSAAALVGAVLLLVRYAQAGRDQRLRMRPLVWSIFAAAPLVAAIVAMLALGVPESSPWFTLVSSLLVAVLCMFPVSIAISVLRYRVFDIDVVVRRSAVYGVLLVVIAVGYVAPPLPRGSRWATRCRSSWRWC